MIKDFLFFNYSWVPNSTYIFKSFENSGYSCDFVDEDNIRTFIPDCKYKVVILYLHEPWTIPFSDNIINNYCQDSILIQHDDTDFENVQRWSSRNPNFVMQRELTVNTYNPYNCPVYPHHFPIESIYREEYQDKEFDICFIGAPTNPRRELFISKVLELANGSLSHLKWFVKYNADRNKEETIKHINKSKIALNYPGNSFDAHRIWEASSARCCIIQPQLPILSVSDNHMPFGDYIRINMDCSDLEEKILYALQKDNYKLYAENSFKDYNENHNPKKCFEKYHDIVLNNCPEIVEKEINPI